MCKAGTDLGHVAELFGQQRLLVDGHVEEDGHQTERHAADRRRFGQRRQHRRRHRNVHADGVAAAVDRRHLRPTPGHRFSKKKRETERKKTNLAGRCVGAAGRGRHQDELDGGQIVDGDGHVGPHAGLVAVRRQQTLDVQQEAGARQQHQNVGVDRAAAQARHQQRHRRRQLPKSNGSTR